VDRCRNHSHVPHLCDRRAWLWRASLRSHKLQEVPCNDIRGVHLHRRTRKQISHAATAIRTRTSITAFRSRLISHGSMCQPTRRIPPYRSSASTAIRMCRMNWATWTRYMPDSMHGSSARSPECSLYRVSHPRRCGAQADAHGIYKLHRALRWERLQCELEQVGRPWNKPDKL
jgi:hypothetical protein